MFVEENAADLKSWSSASAVDCVGGGLRCRSNTAVGIALSRDQSFILLHASYSYPNTESIG